jgi:adenylate cyclase
MGSEGDEMAREIERKFLVINDGWRASIRASARYRQGYLANTGRCSVRVRTEGDKAFINIKSATLGVSRIEFEYPVPVEDAEHMLAHFCGGHIIEKQRFFVEHEGHTWEVDVFEAENRGLVVAELELESEDADFALPSWAGAEVSNDHRYYNVYLAGHPYSQW